MMDIYENSGLLIGVGVLIFLGGLTLAEIYSKKQANDHEIKMKELEIALEKVKKIE